MRQEDFNFGIDKKSIRNISKSIACEVSDKIYHEFLFARYMPEIFEIEKGDIIPIKVEDFKKQLIYRINSKAK